MTKCGIFEDIKELVAFINDANGINNDWTKIKHLEHNVHMNHWFIFYVV